METAPTRVTEHKRSAHSLLVVAPIAWWTAAAALDAASLLAPEPAFLVSTSTWLVGAGLVAALVAGLVGMVNAAPIPTDTAVYRRVLLHLGAVMVVTVLYAFALILRLAADEGERTTAWTPAASALGLVVLAAVGFSGRTVTRLRADVPTQLSEAVGYRTCTSSPTWRNSKNAAASSRSSRRHPAELVPRSP